MKTKTRLFKKIYLLLSILLCSLISYGTTTINLKLFIQGYYAGNSTMVAARMNQGCVPPNSSSVTTQITVRLRNPTTPFAIVETTPATLNTDGTCVVTFAGNYTGSYILNVASCNIGAHCNIPVTVGALPVYYYYTGSIPPVYLVPNEIQIEPGVWAFVSGDVSQNGVVDLLDVSMIQSAIFNWGCTCNDLDGDGNVGLSDLVLITNNLTNSWGVISACP